MGQKQGKYPLILENWGGDSYLVISRGHHDLDAFAAKVREDYDEWGNFFESAYHTYFKATPSSNPESNCWYSQCSPDTRGAFPATVAQEGWLAKFGTQAWDRHKFNMNEIVVPLHDNFGKNPPLEMCGSSHVHQGETFRAKQNVGENIWHVREANDYRIATADEREIGHRIN